MSTSDAETQIQGHASHTDSCCQRIEALEIRAITTENSYKHLDTVFQYARKAETKCCVLESENQKLREQNADLVRENDLLRDRLNKSMGVYGNFYAGRDTGRS